MVSQWGFAGEGGTIKVWNNHSLSRGKSQQERRMIRPTRHHLKDLNPSKKEVYDAFLREYSRFTILVVDDIWSNLPEDLTVQKFIDYKKFNFETTLSARARSCAVNQASAIVRSAIER